MRLTYRATNTPSRRRSRACARAYRIPRSPTMERAGEALSELQKELATPEVEPAKSKVGADAAHPDDKPMQVEIREHEPSGMELFQRIAGTVLPPLATAGIILLFVVFILYQREDLELAPGWVVDESILCIGGRSALDEAAAAILAEVLKKRGLGAKALGPNAISAAHIASLARAEAKLVCLSYLGLGKSSCTCPLCRAAVAPHTAPRHRHPCLLLERRGRGARGQAAA